MSELQQQVIRQSCKSLRMPTIGSQFAHLAEVAVRERQTHVGYLEALPRWRNVRAARSRGCCMRLGCRE
jgi:hypothetical protein